MYRRLEFMDPSVDTTPIAPALAAFFDNVLQARRTVLPLLYCAAVLRCCSTLLYGCHTASSCRAALRPGHCLGSSASSLVPPLAAPVPCRRTASASSTSGRSWTGWAACCSSTPSGGAGTGFLSLSACSPGLCQHVCAAPRPPQPNPHSHLPQPHPTHPCLRRVPAYYALILRSLTVLEGLALTADPNYKLIARAYPYMARRLLTDPAPELR